MPLTRAMLALFLKSRSRRRELQEGEIEISFDQDAHNVFSNGLGSVTWRGRRLLAVTTVETVEMKQHWFNTEEQVCFADVDWSCVCT